MDQKAINTYIRNICNDELMLLNQYDYDLSNRIEEQYEKLHYLIQNSDLTSLIQILNALQPLVKIFSVGDAGSRYLNQFLGNLADRYLNTSSLSETDFIEFYQLAELAAWAGAFQFPFGKLLTLTKKFIQINNEYPQTMGTALARLYTAMEQRDLYGRGLFLKRINELYLYFSTGLDIIPDNCIWHTELSEYFEEHDASLLVMKKLWGETMKVSSFKMPKSILKILKESSVLVSRTQLQNDITFLLKSYVALDWHKVTKESEALAVAALWVTQTLELHELEALTMELATKAGTQEYGGILSPKILKVAVHTLVALGDKTYLSHLVVLQDKLRQKSYREMIQSELEHFARKLNIPPAFITELLLSQQTLDKNCGTDGSFDKVDWRVEITSKHKVKKTWVMEGESYSKAPEPFAGAFPDKVNEVTIIEKKLKKTLQVAKICLERWFIQQKSLEHCLFEEIFLSSPLWQRLIQGLIFNLTDGTEKKSFIVLDGKLLALHGETISPSKEAIITLWHPLNGTEKEANNYIALLKSYKQQQFIKQLGREFFTSSTFPNLEFPLTQRILKQKIFKTLARLRGWDAPMLSSKFFAGLPTLKLGQNEEVELVAKPYGGNETLILLEKIVILGATKISPVVLSEILRDIALFQSKAGVA